MRHRRRRQIAPESPRRDGADLWLSLDNALKSRIRGALESERILTEAEVRRLAEDGRAGSLMLTAELRRDEQKLRELDADPAGSLAELAAVFRDVSLLRRDLDELQSLLDALDERARASRTAWLSAVARSTARAGPNGLS